MKVVSNRSLFDMTGVNGIRFFATDVVYLCGYVCNQHGQDKYISYRVQIG